MSAPRTRRWIFTWRALAAVAASAIIIGPAPASAADASSPVDVFETRVSAPIAVPADAPLNLNPDAFVVFAQGPPPEKTPTDPFSYLPPPQLMGGAAPIDLAGHANGTIPLEELCKVPWASGHHLQCDAAADLLRLNEAYRDHWGTDLAITDSYRSYEGQVSCRARKGTLCATPGTSNHGWGLAVDLAGGINRFGSHQHQWMVDHAEEYGWYLPSWAQRGGSNPEAWHWQHRAGIDELIDAGVIRPEE